ncbi:MAG: sigma-70 family RNA polymerase sigma factor [Acidobacteria bacterium]|nr:sigma-70 family RNA polymerase sigma factor [Acidobacteriota bacterium]
MRAAQSGDATAYLAVLQAIAPRVRQTILRRRGPAASADVEDLVQDVLLSLHVARASYDPARPFLPWLLAIVRNRLADGARRYARRTAHEIQVEDLELASGTPVATSPAAAPDEGRALRVAIEALPCRQRQAVELLKLRELSLREAAAATGMSVGALKVATHRAMAALRRALATSRRFPRRISNCSCATSLR